ncbi:putative ribonuclease H-like domain-containing protein, partial [Tanacetum coccineum]
MSIDDLYNNFKIVEQDVKKSVGANTGAQNLAFMTASSTSSTNDINTAKPAYEVSTVSTNVNTASPQASSASLSDNTVYAFMVENPNGSNLLHQDLEQIHKDDLEAMNLKWQISLLSMRAKRQSVSTVIRWDTLPENVEHEGIKMSDMAEEQVQTNMALMAFSDSEVYNDKSCTKTCLKTYETLKKQCDDLIVKLNQTELTSATYKRGLATIEEQLITYRKNEVLFSKEVVVLKREVAYKYYEIGMLKTEFEKVKQEKEGIDFKIAKFDNASKSLDKLLESQITDKSKKGLGYNVVSLPHPLIYNRLIKLDLSYFGLDEFKEPEFEGYGPRNDKQESNINCDKQSENSKENTNDSLVKEQVSKDENSSVESPLKVDKKTIIHAAKKIEFVKPENNEKPVKKTVSFDHVKINCPYHQRKRVVTRNNYNRVDYDYYAKTSHPSTHKNMTPRVVLLKFGQTSLSTARYFNQKVNTVRPRVVNTARQYAAPVNTVMANRGKPQMNDKGFIDSGCSRHMTGNISYLSDFKEFDGGYVTFGGGAYGGRITGKGTLKTNNLDFDDILLKIPRKDNMYSFDMKNIIPKESLTCLVANATLDESMLWHRRLGHINFKNINKLVKENLVRGLPLKHFENDQTCVTCLKGKKHRASSTKDETNEILKNFIKEIENLVDKKVKIIRCDNGTEFKNKNGVAERRDTTLIEAARTMLVDFKLPTTFWAEVVSTTCYVQNRVLVVKPHNKTPYELFRGFKPALSFMRPFGCQVTIPNTLDNLGKFDGKSDEGFFVGYSLSSKAFRVYNTRTRKVEENLHIGFLENKPMVEGNGPKWLFDIDSLTQSMNYVPVVADIISNEFAGTQGELNTGSSTQKEEISQDYIVMPIWKDASYFDSPSKDVGNDEPKSAADDQKQVEDGPHSKNDEKENSEDDSSPKEVNAAGQHVNTTSPRVNTGSSKLNTVNPSVNTASSYDPDSPKYMFKLGASHTLEATHVEFFSDEDEPEVELGNILSSYIVPTTPNTRIHKDYPIKNMIGDVKSSVQTRRMTKSTSEQGNKKDERGIIIRNKERLVAQGYTQEEDIDYDEVFAHVARIEAIRLFLAYASFMGFIVYQIDVKSAFLYGQIEEEVYVCQPPGFEDHDYPDKVYKVVKALYGLYQAPRTWYETLANYLLGNRFQRGKIDQTLFIKRKKGVETDIRQKDEKQSQKRQNRAQNGKAWKSQSQKSKST